MPGREMKNNIIEVKNLKKVYKKDIRAVDGITFSIQEGEFFGFLGPNGAGKTTTIKLLVNLVKKTDGSVKLDGFEVSEQPNEIYKRIGLAMQEVGLDETATAREMMQLHGRLYHMQKQEIDDQIKKLLELVELERVADRYVVTYSGGMRRRFDLALSLLHNPRVLFLDEPTTGLDPHARRLIWNHLRALNKGGMTIFFTTHSMGEAEALCERIAIIDKGKIITEGSPKNLIKQYEVENLEEVFLKVTGHSFQESELNLNATDPYVRIRTT
ncbi:MAG: ABC transporter ATP-binding protein [Patescibacteria group bacterium]